MAELISKTYASSLFEAVEASKITNTDSISEELVALKEIFAQHPDYVKLFSSPSWGKGEKHKLLDETFEGKLSNYTLNFLRLLVDNGRFASITSIVDAYIKIHEANSGIMQITAITATALDADLKEKLINKLNAVTGKKVTLNTYVDKSVIGGIKLRYDNSEIDATVSSKLDELKHIITSTTI